MKNVSYECISIEDLVVCDSENDKYDAVVMSEVLEHIEKPEDFVKTAVKTLKVLLIFSCLLLFLQYRIRFIIFSPMDHYF